MHTHARVDTEQVADELIDSDGKAGWLHEALWPLIAAAVVLIAATALVTWFVTRSDPPTDDSAEAGFARDMSQHHAQAVEMALIIRDKTENEDIRVLATDIILTQQAQLGIMRGWLDAWNLPPNSADEPMAWMEDQEGHDHAAMEMDGDDALMPGMATQDDLAQLRELQGTDADRLFLELMIAHHQGGVAMAEGLLDLSDNEVVTPLAESIVRAQQNELALMQTLLANLS